MEAFANPLDREESAKKRYGEKVTHKIRLQIKIPKHTKEFNNEKTNKQHNSNKNSFWN